MARLGALEGSGELFDEDRSLGTVRFAFEVWEGPMISPIANGELIAAESVLARLSAAGEARLVLDSGQKITVVMRTDRYFLGSDRAEVVTRGPIPGF
jgi:hypothetical protein